VAVSPYGTWRSPLTAEVAVQGARELAEVSVDGEDVCWLEQRPDEGGRTAVVRRSADGAVADLSPPGADVRTRVHEYGGGPYLVAGGTLYFVEDGDQRLRRLDPGAREPVLLTPEPPSPGSVRYADMVLTPDGRHLICVRETLVGPGAADAIDELVAVPTTPGAGEPVVLASGRDFYASPRLRPDGRQLAYVAWDHPDMPWDGATVELADLGGLAVTATRRVAGGGGESAILPAFSPDGVLHLVTDRTGWWNLYAVAPDGSLRNLAPLEVELGQPPWELGQRLYGFLPDGRVAVVATDAERARSRDGRAPRAVGAHGLPELDHRGRRGLVHRLLPHRLRRGRPLRAGGRGPGRAGGAPQPRPARPGGVPAAARVDHLPHR
jgi:hypothetical protein